MSNKGLLLVILVAVALVVISGCSSKPFTSVDNLPSSGENPVNSGNLKLPSVTGDSEMPPQLPDDISDAPLGIFG